MREFAIDGKYRPAEAGRIIVPISSVKLAGGSRIPIGALDSQRTISQKSFGKVRR